MRGDADLGRPASGYAPGRNRKSLTRRHEATKNGAIRAAPTSASLRLRARYNSLCPKNLYHGPRTIRNELPALASRQYKSPTQNKTRKTKNSVFPFPISLNRHHIDRTMPWGRSERYASNELLGRACDLEGSEWHGPKSPESRE